MFEIVKTKRQQKQFENTWEYFCELYDWENDPYAKEGIRYNLLLPTKRKKVIGTVEFIPYDPNNPESTVERRIPFSQFKDIMLHQHRVWEVDKLCIHKDFQRQGLFELFLHVLFDHANTYQPKYYIGIMEKRFFRMLRISFGWGIQQKGKEQRGINTTLIPVMLDVEKIMQDQEKIISLLKSNPSTKLVEKPRKKPLFLPNTLLNKLFTNKH